MKLMMALATASMIVTSALMQPAVAQRGSGAEYDEMGGNETRIDFQFKLFDTDETGNLIVDTAPFFLPIPAKISPNTIIVLDRGLFRNAVTDYVYGFGMLPSIERGLQLSDYDADGHPNLKIPFTIAGTIFSVGDLVAELISRNGKQYIRYTIYEEYGVTPPSRSFILDPKYLGRTFTPLPNPIDLNKAVNDLTYILNNNLLDGVQPPYPFDPNLLLTDHMSYLIKHGVVEPDSVVNPVFNGLTNLR